MWHKGVGSKIHRGRFDEDIVKLESTAVDLFRKSIYVDFCAEYCTFMP